MIEDMNYLGFRGNEDLITEYFDALFFFREKNLLMY